MQAVPIMPCNDNPMLEIELQVFYLFFYFYIKGTLNMRRIECRSVRKIEKHVCLLILILELFWKT
jgi:hypothetical protein